MGWKKQEKCLHVDLKNISFTLYKDNVMVALKYLWLLVKSGLPFYWCINKFYLRWQPYFSSACEMEILLF